METLGITEINVQNPFNNIDLLKIQKMIFLYNALEEGWTIQKKEQFYVFNKKHHGVKDVYLDTYIDTFIRNNMSVDKVMQS